MAKRTNDPVPASSPAHRPENDVLTVDEIVDRHYGEWVLMRVIEFDEDFWPSKGYMLAHSPAQADLLPVLEREVASLPGGVAASGRHYYSFCAYPMTRLGQEDAGAVLDLVFSLAEDDERGE